MAKDEMEGCAPGTPIFPKGDVRRKNQIACMLDPELGNDECVKPIQKFWIPIVQDITNAQSEIRECKTGKCTIDAVAQAHASFRATRELQTGKVSSSAERSAQKINHWFDSIQKAIIPPDLAPADARFIAFRELQSMIDDMIINAMLVEFTNCQC